MKWIKLFEAFSNYDLPNFRVALTKLAPINESSWDSSDYLGEVKIDGKTYKSKYVCVYDTSGWIEYSVFVEITPQQLLKNMGIWSKTFADNFADYPEDLLFCIFSDAFNITGDVRDYTDYDIQVIFSKDLKNKTNNLNMSVQQFVEIAKNNEQLVDIDDILLLGLDGISFKKTWDLIKKRVGIISDSFEDIDKLMQ